MKPSTVLRKARKVLQTRGWTKGELARNKYRHKVDPTSPSAVKFCAYGAIYNVLGIKDINKYSKTAETEQILEVAQFLSQSISIPAGYWWLSLDDYNDDDQTTAKNIDLLFERAIKLATSKGK